MVKVIVSGVLQAKIGDINLGNIEVFLVNTKSWNGLLIGLEVLMHHNLVKPDLLIKDNKA